MAATGEFDARRWTRLSKLLDQALQMERSARFEWLDTLPDEHADLAPVLRNMLTREACETSDFLARPVALPGLLQDAENADAEGVEIGPYQLVSEIGLGGMGTVWLAERSDGAFKRSVALKLPASAWVPGLAERLRRERDILATLEHPNIARLYDAGVTNEGRPYIALEYVEGKPIDVFCAGRALDITGRLKLFLEVARAVSHAHARLVVHLDLKPNNILVTGEGEVRLLDFGIAKIISGDALDDTLPEAQLTLMNGRALTLDYASPEQIRGEPVTISSDIYSLGVVLFELLAGQRPYKLKRPSAAAVEEAILEQVAPLASSVAGKAAARELRGDLDLILAKALKKNAADRYLSMESFGADVSRYLRGEPVLAQRDSVWYRTRKFIRRNLGAVAASLAILLAIGIGAGVAVWQARMARIEANRAEEVKRFIASIFDNAEPRTGVGGEVLATDLLTNAAARIEKELASNPRASAELGVIVATSLDQMGAPQKGEPILRITIPRAEAGYGRKHAITIRAKVLLANLVRWRDPKAAEALLDDVIDDARALLPETAESLVFAIQMKSFVAAKRDAEAESYAALKESITLAEKYLGEFDEYTVFNLGLLSNTYGKFGRRAEQLAAGQEAMRRADIKFAAKRPHGILSASERFYAEALRANDRPADAIPILRRVLDDQRRLDSAETTRVRHAIRQLALALEASGQVAEALPLMRQVVALEQVQNPNLSEDRITLGDHLVGALVHARRSGDAVAEAGRLSALQAKLDAEPVRASLIRALRVAYAQAMNGDHADAERLALEMAARAGKEHPEFAVEAQRVVAFNARMQRELPRAWAAILAAREAASGQKVPLALQADIAAEGGAVLWDQGRYDEAGVMFDECKRKFEEAQVRLSARNATCITGLARMLLRNGQALDAHALMQVLSKEWEALHPGSVWHGEVLYWLARAQRELGDRQSASDTESRARKLLSKSNLPAMRILLASARAA